MGNTIVDERPWGKFEQFTTNEPTTVKLIYVNAGRRLSYQYHRKRSEFWKVLQGKARVTIDDKESILKEGDSTRIPVGAKHRLEGVSDIVVLEIAYGEFDESDIVRLADDYSRV